MINEVYSRKQTAMEPCPMPTPQEKYVDYILQILLLVIVTIICLAPFAGKA